MNRSLAFKRLFVWTSLELWDFQKIFQVIIFLLSALILSGLIVISSSSQVVLVPVGIFILYFLVKRPELGVLAIIVIIASIIFETSLPQLHLPGARLHVTDIILFALLMKIPFKALTDRNFRFLTTPLDFPLLIFIFAAFISAGVSIFVYGLDFNWVVGTGLRRIMYYFLFFVITNLIRDKKQIRVIFGGLFGIAVIVSLAMIIQAKVGESVHIMPGRVESTGQAFQATRIIPPGEVAIFVTFISAVCAMSIMNKPFFRTAYFYLIPVFGGGLLLTYNRQYWGSEIFSLFVFAVLISKRGKRRFFSWLAIVIVSIILIVLPLTRLSKTFRDYSGSIVERFSSIFTVKETFASSSLEWRKLENQYAWRSIVKHPIFGIGLYNRYRPPVPGQEDRKDWDVRYFIHNGYLWILINMGLLGFLPFMCFYISFLARGFSNWRKIRDPIEKSAVIGYTISGIALSLSILVEPRIMQDYGIVVIATIIGLNEVIIKRNDKGSHASGR